MKGVKDKTGRFIRNLADKNCKQCGKLFHPRFSNILFCSRVCMGLSKKKDRNRNCVTCGKTFWAESFKTRFCSQKCYTASGIRSQKGERAIGWKGGITPITRRIRTSTAYKRWRTSVLEQGDYSCSWCESKINLNVDHIIAFSDIMTKLRFEQGNENLFEKAMNYNLLWDINNGRILCESCHKKTPNYLRNNG